MSEVLRKVTNAGWPFDHEFYCPGCKCMHGFNAYQNHEPRWQFNGDLVKPTIAPSLLVRWGLGKVCHLYMKEGKLQFLADCTHALAGQTVEMGPSDE